MHDLRKQALLESKKTVSRKARSKESTPPISRGGSAAVSPKGSRVASRAGSDDESEVSDETEYSTPSLGTAPADEENEGDDDIWVKALEERIEALAERKRSSTEGREEMLKGMIVILKKHYAQAELENKMDILLPALLKCLKSGQSEREIVLALKTVALVLVTDPSDAIYDAVEGPVKHIINESEYSAAKLAALRTLAVVTFWGGASEEETAEVMGFYLDIVSSDGAVIGETDNGEIVVAAIEEWGFLATQMEDVQEVVEEAMEAFVDQLESSDVKVQIAAGDNIALMYEKSYTEAEPGDDPINYEEDEPDGAGNRYVKRYTVYRQSEQLLQTLERLTRVSSKHIAKKDRKQLHFSIRDVINSIERPAVGPRYSIAEDWDRGEYGSRLKVLLSEGNTMTIDKWWKLHRLNGLKRLLQSGFMVHYQFNQTIFDSLPVIVDRWNDDAPAKVSRGKKCGCC